MKTETKHNVTILIRTWNAFKHQVALIHKKYDRVNYTVSGQTITINDAIIQRTANSLTLNNLSPLPILKEILRIQDRFSDGHKNIEESYEFEEYVFAVATRNEPEFSTDEFLKEWRMSC
ncbi:hypothetical protein [Pedobacter nyackensis]|uniref:hypothetical protein n=1 Tax=Pedobacter nyackensis TaxID=475255 RepID=UPI00292FE31E|nr:hypothetical protein [Pedobacter nyackensis]